MALAASQDKKPIGINGVDNLGRPIVQTASGIVFVLTKNGTWADQRRMKGVGNKGASTSNKYVAPEKVAPSKVADYIRRVYIDGMARIVAYEEFIDSRAKEMPVSKRYGYVNRLEKREDFEHLKQFIMEEDQRDMIIRSHTIRNKTFELLVSTLEAAQKSVDTNPDDPKILAAATTVVKTMQPILAEANKKEEEEKPKLDESNRLKLRAARVVS